MSINLTQRKIENMMVRKNQHIKTIRQVSEEEALSFMFSHKDNQQKIEELHTCMKSYFDFDHKKNIEAFLPKIQRIEQEIEKHQESLTKLDSKDSLVQQRKNLLIKKNKLQESIKFMANEVEKVKSKIKATKIERQFIQNQITNQDSVLEKIKKYEEESLVKSEKVRAGKSEKKKYSPTKLQARRRSVLLINDSSKMFNSGLLYQPLEETSVVEKWRKIQTLLQLISTQQPTHLLECKLAGDMSISVGKKVFKDYSVDDYFNQLMKDATIKKQMLRIMNFLEIYD